jgi:hypothetical protein
MPGWRYRLAQWIVKAIAFRIHGFAVLQLCIAVADDYRDYQAQNIEAEEIE